MSESPGDRAQRLLDDALGLAIMVRDESREDIAANIAQIPDDDKDALIVVLAALMDVNQPVAELLRWVTWDEDGRPLSAADRARIGAAEYERLRCLGVAGRQMPDWVRAGKSAVVRERAHRVKASA